jgi:hypothetical protein
MNPPFNLQFLLVFLIPALTHAAPVQYIDFNDGSRVRAEVISLDEGVYTLRSEMLGEMRIPADRIKSISSQELANTAAAPDLSTQAQVNSIREALIQDPNAMANIQSLQNDPLVTDILNDEAVMRAINSGDLETLINDPKFKALMEHSTVREITQGDSL